MWLHDDDMVHRMWDLLLDLAGCCSSCPDAPWLSKAQNRKDVRFVHPKISAGVGEKLGIRSLRRLLMESHADSLDFGLPSEAFGQTESLTRRLRHILGKVCPCQH